MSTGETDIFYVDFFIAIIYHSKWYKGGISLPIDQKLVGSRLKSLRIAHEIKQLEIAHALGLKQSAVSGHECGVSLPNAASLYWYAQRYNVSSDYILGLTDDPAPTKKAAPGEAERPKDGSTFTQSITGLSEDSESDERIRQLISEELRKELPEILPDALAGLFGQGRHDQD